MSCGSRAGCPSRHQDPDTNRYPPLQVYSEPRRPQSPRRVNEASSFKPSLKIPTGRKSPANFVRNQCSVYNDDPAKCLHRACCFAADKAPHSKVLIGPCATGATARNATAPNIHLRGTDSFSNLNAVERRRGHFPQVRQYVMATLRFVGWYTCLTAHCFVS